MRNLFSNSKRRASMLRQSGCSLIEVMVTLTVVSLAALGMAGLHTVATRANTTALQESQAATLTQDLIERIRANSDGDYTIAFGGDLDISRTLCEGTAADCDLDDMAQYDLLYWKCSMGATKFSNTCASRGIPGQLPGADGSVTLDDNVYTITIRWFDVASNETRTMIISSVI